MYLNTLRKRGDQYGLKVLGYCLMTNHVHLIVVPEREDSLAKALGRTHNDYARWFNVIQLQTGHLWQNRFFSCPLEKRHQWEALRYVELNPVRARMVNQAEQWPWSSARMHLRGQDETGLLSVARWREHYNAQQWREALDRGLAAADLERRIREATRTGRPFGSDAFIQQLEKQTGRRLRRQRSGPKPKSTAAGSP